MFSVKNLHSATQLSAGSDVMISSSNSLLRYALGPIYASGTRLLSVLSWCGGREPGACRWLGLVLCRGSSAGPHVRR